MSLGSDRISVRNTSPDHTAADVRNKPASGTTNTHALYVKQYGSSGHGQGLVVESDNPTVPVLTVEGTGGGEALRLSSGSLTFGVAGDVNLYRSGVNELSTDDDFVVTSGLTALGVPVPGGEFQPFDHGYDTWTNDPENIQGASGLVSGTVYLRKMHIRRSFTPTALTFSISVPGTGVTAGQNFAGLYSSAGALLDSVGIDSDITSAGVTEVAISPGPLTSQSFVWASLVVNASSPPQLHRTTTTTTPPNANLAASVYRNAVNGSGQTSLPPLITPASNSGSGTITFWAALRG